jgi:uncharacterized membrane protein YcaP (DUF421 family)
MNCNYYNILGEVGKGVHSYRIFDIAIVDVIFTILAAFLISQYYPKIPFGLSLIVLFLLGIVMHRIFCVKTTLDKLIFSNN